MNVLCTYMLTRLLWYASDFVRWILNITAYNKLESKLSDELHCTLPSTLPIALDCTLTACGTVRAQLITMAHSQPAWVTLSSKLSRRSQVHSWACSQGLSHLLSMAHFPACLTYALQYALKTLPSTLPGMLSRMLPIALDGTLQSCLTVHSQDALKHTPENALKDAPNCTRWHTPSLHECTLPSNLSRRSQAHSRECSQAPSRLHSIAHTQHAWRYAPM